MPNKSSSYAKPFLRWAGGKSWLTKHLDNIIGEQKFNNYHEPFLGGGATFFYLNHTGISFLSDLNAELIHTYIAIKETPDSVIHYLQNYKNTSDDYYIIRNSHPTTAPEIAARFIYLNQTSFNGLYRVNAKGEYNVPYGNRTKHFLEEDTLRVASQKLQNTVLNIGDFEEVKENIAEGDLVFLDPPYTVSHDNNGFIKYNRNLFSLEDQYRLRSLVDIIKKNGAYYILTNAAHETIYNIFYQETDKCYKLTRASLIGGQKATRGPIQEYIFTNLNGRLEK